MLFSNELKESVHRMFTEAKSSLGICREEICKDIENCNEDEKVILELFYSTMPCSDIGDYDFSLYKKYADFGIFIGMNSQWDINIPEDILLNYVIYYRINNELIEDCREFFHSALKERISGKNMKEAALEINKWCAEHVTYQSTDGRTASPLTVLRSSYGRCGEESTFTVTAMRSAGIPARQIYTPRWAHCDDNHAWVEVWCDGEWYFLGACEPEPVLNKGWFNDASARAMLTDSKAFLPISGEEAVSKNGQTIILNEISRYAESRYFRVKINGLEDASGVTVHFELLNSAEFFPIASVITDNEGCAGLTLGLGSIHIHAVKDSSFIEAFADTGEVDCITLDFSKAVQVSPEGCEEFCFRAPNDSIRNQVLLNEDQKALKRMENSHVEKLRKEYVKSYYNKDKGEKVAAEFNDPQKVIEILKSAEGNFNEIYDFLAFDTGSENRELKLQLLESLAKKDYRDVRFNILQEHFEWSLKYKGNYPAEIFVPYILCPRVHYENLSKYREHISSLFDEETILEFQKQPKLIWEYVLKFDASAERANSNIPGTPLGIIRSRQAALPGCRLLFTAICRTLGIPARVNPVDLTAQYYKGGSFINAENSLIQNIENSILTLSVYDKQKKWNYFHNWSIGVLNNGIYQTLDLSDRSFIDGSIELSLVPGSYRIITTSRMPNGNQFAKKYYVQLEKNKNKSLSISLCKTEIKDMLEDISFAPFSIRNESNEPLQADSVIGDDFAILAWLEEGREPTEHILNEFIEAKDLINSLNTKIIFMIRNSNAFNNATFAKACREIKNVKVFYTDFSESAVTMARRMYVDPDSLPLTVAAYGTHGLYAFSGYNVGIVDLMVKVINTSTNQL